MLAPAWLENVAENGCRSFTVSPKLQKQKSCSWQQAREIAHSQNPSDARVFQDKEL